MDILEHVRQAEKLDEEIRSYLKPKLLTMLLDGRLNKGEYSKIKKLEDIIYIDEYYTHGDKIYVCVDIWWGSDVNDREGIKMTKDEWDAIKNHEQ